MDDRFYLALYDERRIPALLKAMDLPSVRFVKDVILAGYMLKMHTDEKSLVLVKSRFEEAPGKLYALESGEEEKLKILDELLGPHLKRHMSMAADDDRLYNVFVYVMEEA